MDLSRFVFRVHNTIHGINHYPVDPEVRISFYLCTRLDGDTEYPVDSDNRPVLACLFCCPISDHVMFPN